MAASKVHAICRLMKAATLALAALSSTASAETLWIAEAAPVPCASAQALATALSANAKVRLPIRVGPPRTGEPTLRLSGSTGVAILALSREGAAPLERRALRYPPEDCEALPATLALLASSWLETLPGAPPAPRKAPALRPTPLAPPIPEPSPPIATPVMTPLPNPIVSPVAPAHPPRLELAVAAGPSLDLGAGRAVARGDLRLSTPLAGPLRLGLKVGLGWGASEAAEGGRVRASVVHAALLLQLALPAPGLELALAPGIAVIDARAEDLPGGRARTLVDPALEVDLLWRHPLGARAFGVLGLDLSLRTRRETLSLEGLGPVLTLSPIELEPFAGLGVSLF